MSSIDFSYYHQLFKKSFFLFFVL
ncbi:hypothetical protein RDI58_020361 [Solanum bulbocastanum]|uniref:Uncharacterized protein n=1 Tax=Solanum bulbocastanum TaxID=147425 RepID=A0AAN8T8M1_SOLBU